MLFKFEILFKLFIILVILIKALKNILFSGLLKYYSQFYKIERKYIIVIFLILHTNA